MTPCVLADRTVLHIKLVPTNCSMVDSPCPDVASHISLAKWTPVNDAFLRRPRPWPRQGRRLGPPQVWNFSFLAPPNPPNPLNPLNPQNVKTLATFSQQTSRGLPPTQATATPRPDPLLLPRPPGLRSQQASQGHIHGFLWASKLAVCQPLNAPNPPNPPNPLNPQNVKTLATFSQQASRGLPPTQATATPRPDPLLLPRPPGLRSQQASQGHIHGFLWASKLAVWQPLNAPNPPNPPNPSQPPKRQNPCNLQPTGVQRLASNAGHSDPTARSIASSTAARPSQPTGVPRPHPWLLMGVQACRLPAPKRSKPSKPSKPSQPPKRQNPCNLQPTGVQRLASNAGHSDTTARSIASSTAARPSQPTGVPRPHPWLLMGVQACRLPAPKRSKPSKPSKPSQPPKRQNPCNLQPTGVQRLASNAGHSDPTARSIASSKAARPSQPTGVPRPHPWLLMGVQACRLPAPKRSKPSKPSKPSQPPKRQNPCNLQPTGVQRLASNAGHSDPTARSIASSKAARPSQPTGVPRPHPWLLMGVQACRLAAPKRSKPSKPSKPLSTPKTSKPLQPSANRRPEACLQRRPQRPHGQIHCFFQGRQAFAANRRPKATSMASYGRPSLPFANAGHSDPTARPIASSKAARPSQPTGVPRPHPWLLMGVQACRLPAPKRSKPSKPSQPPKRQNPCNLQPTGVQRLASNAGHSDPTARSIASSKAARPSQPTGVPRPHPWLLMGVQACRLPTPKRSKPSKPSQPPKRQNPCNLQPTGVQRLASNAGHSDPTARSIASSKAARPSQPTGVPRPHPWLLMGVQACRLAAPKRSKPSKPSQPPKRQNPCNLQPTGVQRLASNAGHSDPTARSIASSKAARPSQPTGVPRPHPWLLMGVQACRLPAPKRSKPSKPSKPSQPPKRQNPCNLQPTGVQRLASNAGHSDPTARSIASSKAARPSQPTGVPRLHPWLLMGVQACRLPAPKPLKRSKPSKPPPPKPSQPPKRQNPCNLQPTGVQRPASNAGHSDPTARSIAGTLETPQTLETLKTVRYFIFLVITSSATFPLSGQM